MLKIKLSADRMEIVKPPEDIREKLTMLPDVYNVKEYANGFSIVALPANLFRLLYKLSCEYDIEVT